MTQASSDGFDEIDAKCLLLGIFIVKSVREGMWRIERSRDTTNVDFWFDPNGEMRWNSKEEALQVFLNGDGKWS